MLSTKRYILMSYSNLAIQCTFLLLDSSFLLKTDFQCQPLISEWVLVNLSKTDFISAKYLRKLNTLAWRASVPDVTSSPKMLSSVTPYQAALNLLNIGIYCEFDKSQELAEGSWPKSIPSHVGQPQELLTYLDFMQNRALYWKFRCWHNDVSKFWVCILSVSFHNCLKGRGSNPSQVASPSLAIAKRFGMKLRCSVRSAVGSASE